MINHVKIVYKMLGFVFLWFVFLFMNNVAQKIEWILREVFKISSEQKTIRFWDDAYIDSEICFPFKIYNWTLPTANVSRLVTFKTCLVWSVNMEVHIL